MKDDSRKKLIIVTGLLFIFAGILLNEWVLAALFATDGVIGARLNKIIIWAFDIISIFIGMLLIYFRKNVRIQINIALLFGTLVMFLFIAEVFLRLTGLPEDKQEGLKLSIQNPNGTGSYRLKPNLDVVTKVASKDVIIKTNSLGMRWREVSRDNPLEKERIAFIGDSFTFGCWADKVENTFVGGFDSLLNSEKFEVLNFGVGGYGLEDMELQIREEILPFRPDYVILMFFNGNDFRDTYLGKDKYDVATGVARWDTANINSKIPEEFRKHANSTRKHANSTISKFKSFATNLSVYRLLAQTLNISSVVQTGKNKNTAPILDFSVNNQFTSYSFWSQITYPEVAVEAKDLSLEVLDNIRELCYHNHIQLIVVTIPFKEQVYAFSLSGENYNISLPQKYIEEYATTHSVPYLDLLPMLRSYIRENNKDIYIQGDPHFNNDGHRIVGELIAKFFEEAK